MTEPYLGTVMIWAPNFAPRGWAFCQGQLLAVSTNTALFSLLGTVYGGNGTTNFGLPNLGGRIPLGQGQSPGTSAHVLGQTGGSENVTLLQANLPPHTHSATVNFTGGPSVTVNASEAIATADKPVAGQQLGDVTGITKVYVDAGGTQVPLGGVVTGPGNLQGQVQVGLTGNAVPVANMQPYQVLNYVIALEGVFPSRN